MDRVRVLVVEDDEGYQRVFTTFFEAHEAEFSWSLAKTGISALHALEGHSRFPIDVALLDWRLPGEVDGLNILQAIRSDPSSRYILALMVTGDTYHPHMDAAFEAGADDYIAKPFRERELLLRLRGLLRRREMVLEMHGVFRLSGLTLDPQGCKVAVNNKPVHLHPAEFELLKLFMRRPNTILSGEYLWEMVRGYPSKTASLVLSKHIGNLRKKLGPWGDRIETVRNQGYLLNSRYPVTAG